MSAVCAGLETTLAAMTKAIFPTGAVWVARLKKASKVPDITEDAACAVALPSGLVDVKVCAIDELWSACGWWCARSFGPDVGAGGRELSMAMRKSPSLLMAR